MKSKNFSINLICQLIVFSTNMVINFFLTPYILKKLGTEAYGFIGLINNFVNYLSVVTIALNSMAGRYITLSYHKGEKETAEAYYSSVFFANVILSIVVFTAAIVLTVNVSNWLNVPTVLLKDVRVTIILAAVNTIISLITVVYGIAAFIKNKLYKNSMGQMIAAIARTCMMIVTFALFEAHMWYYTLAAIVAAVILLLVQMRITSKLCPELTIDIKKLQVKKISEIIKSGVSAIVEQFLEEGGAVYACVFEKGAFPFTQIISQRDVEKMRGSKYVKSDPQDIYGKITESLRNNQKVLFIGLPCQVQAAKNFISPKLQENFYSVDLICHGCGSPEILKKYLLKKDIDIDNIEKIRFRTKTKFGLVTEWRFLSRDGTEDDYLKTFLTGLSYTENCFECKFARLSRAGDVTIGDSWGSELPSEEQERGISLILCQTAKGQRLINSSKIHVEDVNLDRAIEFNHQLRCPMKKPKRYDVFWNGIKKGHSLHFMLLRCFPKSTIMLFVKKIKKCGGEI